MAQKIHLKLNNKPICGIKRRVRKLKFAAVDNEVTCENCKRAIRT